MGRTQVGRATFSAAIVGMVLAQVVAGCGSTKEPGEPQGGSGGATGGTSDGGSSTGDSGGPGDSAGTGDTGSGGTGTSGGASVTGGAGIGAGGVGSGGRITGLGGKSGVAGSAGSGGSFGFGGSGSGGVIDPAGGSLGTGGEGLATGGASSCLEGAPCSCKKLVGTIECSSEGVGTCSCPPAAECAATAAEPCFEPCGGEPFGAWVLEDSCFSATSSTTGNQDCQKLIQGTPGANDLRLRILDGGEMQLAGIEDWSISAQVALACLSLNTVNSCDVATFWPGALLFSSDRSADCEKNACGVCDCASEAKAEVPSFSYGNWSREGTDLHLGFVTSPYCVTGDELWIGGSDGNGNAKVSYKFKKQSCAGTPVPCAQRTTETCQQGFSCSVGFCKATTATQQRCSTAFSPSDCGVLQGCVWDPTGCAGDAAESCNFENCAIEPGCTWGAPRERCGGQAWPCEGRDPTQCAGGCAVRVCQSNFDEYGQCALLQNATDCGKAPGCVFAAGACTGQSACIAQTDAAICDKLQCLSENNCGGTPTECSTLSLASCHSVPGCRLEW